MISSIYGWWVALFVVPQGDVLQHAVDTAGYWAQAMGTVAAVFASIALYGLQRRRDAKRHSARLSAVRKALVEVAKKGSELVHEVKDPANVFQLVGSWRQYRAFRSRQFMEFHDIVVALPVADIAESGLLDIAMKLRINLQDMSFIIGESDFTFQTSWTSSLHMITYCEGNFREISAAVGIKRK
ncbi:MULTISPECIES: hypothetical protein [Paraburkholderia]|uniref:hypothetical protein n=1 Tax=Paraburkholderia TaxID=1822464 RepID=UPI00225283DE|nr:MULTISPECIES: hypothetical protein [Paraburkholderia]MCX4156160.1 hypothetical protein [Paraburkholderia aspalathi]MDN7165566.1 hypothetical protein [Paraburkholderia sp. SECH2]MDQ6394052.1 hypothetical protein [Paraburkholderia aspalathi]